MRKELLLMVNPNAGQRRANRFLPDIIQYYNHEGYDVSVYVTMGTGDADRYLRKNKREYERVVCIGGDGTLNETISGLMQSGLDCPVGYIPSGTTNDYAASIGLSTDVMKACEDCVNGEVCEFDIGSFNGRYFTYTASCGAFAKASYSTSQAAKNALGHLAYVMEGIADLPNIHPIHMRFEADGAIYENDYVFCSITNALSVGGILKLDPRVVSMNDGKFEVMLIQYPHTPIELTRILSSLNSMDLSYELIDFFTASELKVYSTENLEWTIDGERGANGHEFEVLNLKRKMKIILPSASIAKLPIEQTK